MASAPRKRRLIILTGAPSPDQLSWDERILKNTVIPEIQSIRDRKNPSASTASASTPSSSNLAHWRHIPLHPDRHALPTGLSPFSGPAYLTDPSGAFSFIEPSARVGLSTSFLSTASTSVDETALFDSSGSLSLGLSLSDTQEDFHRHTFAVHTSLLSSQVAGGGGDEDHDDSTITTTLTPHKGAPEDPKTPIITPPFHLPPHIPLTPLSALPSAATLLAIHPQTPTPTLLCTLLARSAPRLILPRRHKPLLPPLPPTTLLDLTLADDTSTTGFTVTFFLPPSPPPTTNTNQSHQPPTTTPLTTLLPTLHPGDTLLLRNVALHPYRNRVCGQSLAPAVRRARTAVHLLARRGVWLHDPRALRAALGGDPGKWERLESVREWGVRFVGGAGAGGSGGGGGAGGKRGRDGEGDMEGDADGKRRMLMRVEREELPPDTQ